MRDENGFKCHTSSESHVRQMLLIGEDPQKHIETYSQQFQRGFLTQLRTAHGEKRVDANRFYQEYIANKEHIHMNATKWVTLGEFVKYIGRESICRVEEGERGGWLIAWVDNSPDALRRQDAVRKKERMEKGDELREMRAIKEQVERAKKDIEGKQQGSEEPQKKDLVRLEGEKVKLAFGAKKDSAALLGETREAPTINASSEAVFAAKRTFAKATATAAAKISIPAEAKPKKNVFASTGKKDKSKDKPNKSKADGGASDQPPKRPMSEAERIMKEEMERNKHNSGVKRQRIM